VRVGIGYDVHRLVTGRPLVIGGVAIPHDKGLDGHSDADVLLHAICDAILGAAGMGDIGIHFPDNNPEFKNISSLKLLSRTWEIAKKKCGKIINIDATIFAESPRISPYTESMKQSISETLKVSFDQINIKATTTEGLGFVGRKEGIAAMSVVLVD
jgi:2-C-methyl-D-erythritol 2,4-cyclodiphosphate synthase